MEFTTLGNSGLKVSKIILGGMSIGFKEWGAYAVEDEQEVFNLLKHAYDKGIRTWDTADVYSNGQSERLIGKFLKKYNINRSTVTILSKCYFAIDDDLNMSVDRDNFINRYGLSRKHILDAVDASCERLGTYIDLLQIHRYDDETPIEETMCALNDVVRSGKVRYIGASSMRTYQFIEMQHVAEKNGWAKFISMQNLHNLLYREEEREMVPYCQKTGVGLIPWSPLARGILCRPLKDSQATVRASSDAYIKVLDLERSKSNQAIINRVEELASKHKVSMAQIGMAWSLAKGVNPIIGFSKAERIDEAVGSLSVRLSEEELEYLEEPYEARPVQGIDLGDKPENHGVSVLIRTNRQLSSFD